MKEKLGGCRWRCMFMILAVLIVATSLTLSIENPVEATGFSPTSIHENYGNDSVNLLNGNLTMIFPFVKGSPLQGGKLVMGLSGVYNSKIWRASMGAFSRSWSLTSPGIGLTHYYSEASTGELGVGWTMNFGYILSEESSGKYIGAVYYAPDGSMHSLKLETAKGNTYLADDGSFIRATSQFTETDYWGVPIITSWILQLPNGIRHELTHVVNLGFPYRTKLVNGWYPEKIIDANGNYILIEYHDDYPRMIRRVSDGFSMSEILFTVKDTADTDETCLADPAQSHCGEPPELIFEETFDQPYYLLLYPLSASETPDWATRWTKHNGQYQFPGTNWITMQPAPCTGNWVHIHHPDEETDFVDCAQDNTDPENPNGSLYFGRDNQSHGQDCTYDYRMDYCATGTASYDKRKKLHIKAVSPVISEALPPNSFLSFDFLREVRPGGPRPTPDAGNVNWDTDNFMIWVETVTSVGTLIGQFRLAEVNNLSQSPGRWLNSGPLDLNRFAGARIRLRFEFDATQNSGGPDDTQDLDRGHLGVLVDNVRVEVGGSSANHVEGLYDAAFIRNEPDPLNNPEANPQAYTKIDFLYTKRSVENVLAERIPAINQDMVLLTEVQFAPGDHEIGPLSISFDYNQYGELKEVVYPAGAVARYDYASFEAPTSTAIPDAASAELDLLYGNVVSVGSSSFTPSVVGDGSILGWMNYVPITGKKNIQPPSFTKDIPSTATVVRDPYNRWWFQMKHRGVTAKSVTLDQSKSISYWTYQRDSGVFDVFATGLLRLNPRYCAVLRHKGTYPSSDPTSAVPVPGETTVVGTRVYHYLAPDDDLNTDTDDDVGADSGLLRKVEYYSGEATTEGLEGVEGIVKFHGAPLLREEWITYEHRLRPLIYWRAINGELAWYSDARRRVDPHEVVRETIYHDDSVHGDPTRVKVVHRGYSFGHYDAVEYWDTFDDGVTYQLRRREETLWNPDTLDYSLFRPGWILDKWVRRSRSDVVQLPDGTTEDQYAYSEAAFDAEGNITTLVQRGDEAHVDGTLALSDGDTKVTYTYGASGLGQATQEIYEVKERGVPLRRVTINNGYSSGVLTLREVVDDQGVKLGGALIDRVVDWTSGRVLFEWSPQLKVTSFSHDALGRITEVLPQAFVASPELATNIRYVDPNRTDVYRGTEVDPLIRTTYLYDGLGRVIEERRLVPHPDDPAQSAEVKRVTEYDTLGRKRSESEWVDAAVGDPPKTTWEYDYWDRPVTVTYADHTADSKEDAGYRRTTYSYKGMRQVTITHSVATDDPGREQESVAVTRTLDSLGRLTAVESSAAGGVRATYTYDVGDRLSWVELDDGINQQYRQFSYDDTGRLRFTDQPEAGRVEYGTYEPFGNPTVIQDARGAAEDYWFEHDYDGAGRIQAIRRMDPEQDQTHRSTTLAETFYDGSYAENGAGRGMPVRMISYADDGTLLSTRNLYYRGAMGQLTGEGTVFANWSGGSSSEELRTTYGYNTLGALSDVVYPAGASETRDVTDLSMSYRYGLLDRVESFSRGTILAAATYNPAGGPHKLSYGNGLQTVITPDVRNRPSRITFQDPGTGQIYFDSGLYGYDGSANITDIGTDAFRYDGHLRLTSATIANSVPTPRTFTYSYDGFGNMKSKELDAGLPCDAVCLAQRALFDFTSRSYLKPGSDSQPDVPTNRIESDLNFAYDLNGNLIKDGAAGHLWDTRDRMESRTQPGGTFRYSYDASGYRILAQDLVSQREVFYLRTSQGQVLTEYARPMDVSDSTPQWARDYIYGNGGSLAMVENAEPLAPSGAYSVLSGGTTARLTWLSSPEADVVSYRLYRAATAEEEPVLTATATGTTVTATLTVPTYFSVMAVDAAGSESPATENFYVQPNDTTPGPDVAFLNLLQTSYTPIAMDVSWAEVTGADHQGYDLFRRHSSVSFYPAEPLNGDIPLHGEVYVDTDASLVAGETYVYKVVTRDTAGNRSAGLTGTATARQDRGGGPPRCVPGFPCLTPRAEFEWEVDEPRAKKWSVAACGVREESPSDTHGAGGLSACLAQEGAGDEWDGMLAAPYRVVGTGVGDWRMVWLHTDHLGSTRMTSTTGPTILSYHTYEPFGWEIPSSVDASPNTHQFTGHERDRETGLDYMLARYHSSDLARFLSADPGSDTVPAAPQSWNHYAYVRNNPVAANDPTGEALNLAAAGVGAGVGGAIGGAFELGTQLWAGNGVDWQKVGASALGGAATGGVAGLTMGSSLFVEVVGAGTGAVLGGVVERGADGDASTVPLEGDAMIVDAAGGAMGAAASKLAEPLVVGLTSSLSETGRQVVKNNPVVKKAVDAGAKVSTTQVGTTAGRAAANKMTEKPKKKDAPERRPSRWHD